MNKEIILKKNIFGGFDRRQVIEYIAQLQAQCADIQTHNEIEEIKSKIASFKKAIDQKNQAISSLTDELNMLRTLNEEDVSAEGIRTIIKADGIVSAAKAETAEHVGKIIDNHHRNSEVFESLFAKLSSLNSKLIQTGKDFEKISENLKKIRTDEEQTQNAENKTYTESDPNEITEEIIIVHNDTYTKEFHEELITDKDFAEEPEIEYIPEEIENNDLPDDFNYIDNFFSELEKLTGENSFDDNDITQITDASYEKSNHNNSDEFDISATDEAFDELLKNVFSAEE